MDSSESPTHGHQEGSVWNGHFACTCYHPLFCFNRHGDLERAMLRKGNVHSADDWRSVLEPVVARYRPAMMNRYFRGDAAFAQQELYEYLEAERFHYAIRLPGNDILHREIEHLTKRPVGRPSFKPQVFYHSFMYQAKTWSRHRRVVAKVEWYHDELFPRVGFIVTFLNRPAEDRGVGICPRTVRCEAQGRPLAGRLQARMGAAAPYSDISDLLRGMQGYLARRNVAYRPAPVNHLDLRAQGLVLFAKSKRCETALHRLFDERRVRKRYLAATAPFAGALYSKQCL